MTNPLNPVRLALWRARYRAEHEPRSIRIVRQANDTARSPLASASRQLVRVA